MKQIFLAVMMLATLANAQQADSTDILFILKPQNDTTRTGAYVAGQLVCAKPYTVGNWSVKERNRINNLIARVPISMDSAMFYLQQDSLRGGRPKYRLRPHTIRLLKQLPHKQGITRVTAEQLAQGLDSVNVYASVRFDEQNIFSLSILRSQLQKWWRMIQPTVTVYDTVYIDTGGTLEYSTAASAEANENRDVGADTVIVFKATTSDGTADGAVTFAGWGASDTLEFVGDWTDGVQNLNKYHIEATGVDHLTVSANNFTVKNVQFVGAIGGSDEHIVTTANNVIVQNCLFNAQGSSGSACCILSSGSIRIVNNLAYNFASTSTFFRAFYITNGTANIYNNTIIGNGYGVAGVDRTAGTVTAKNNIVLSLTTCFSGTMAKLTNIANDATGNIQAFVLFADSINGNFALADADVSGAKTGGTDLSAEGVTTDITGATRPLTGISIGAFQYFEPIKENTDKKSRYKGFDRGFRGGWKK